MIKRVAAAIALSFAAAGTSASLAAEHPMIGEEAPTFSLESLTGEAVSLEDFRGRTVVLHFGTGW